MRKLAFLVIVCCANSTQAALLRYEPFNYVGVDVGTTVEGKTNPDGATWVGAYSSATAPSLIKVASGNLAVPPEMGPSVGNSAEIDGGPSSVATNPQQSGKSLRLPLGATISSGSVYYSLGLRIDALTGSNNTNGGFFIALDPNTGATTVNPTSTAGKIQARIDPVDGTKYNLGIFTNHNATAAALSWSTLKLNVGQTYFIVASYDRTLDVARLWIDPNLSGPQPLPDAIDTVPSGTLINLSSIILRQSPAPHLTLDELRVGTEWRDVAIPEPGSLGLLLTASVLMSWRRRLTRE